ncbi:MAG: patatin-like phospholipase family protein [Dehalococcoidia bacterium]
MQVREMMREAWLESAADEAFVTLSSSPLFGGLDPEVLRRLAPRLTSVHVRAGETLVRQGDAGTALFVVVYGRLRAVLADESGTERILGEIGRGETVGEMAVLTGEPRSSSVIAVRDSELIRLDRADFERLSTAQPGMILELMRVLITRYRDTLRAPRAARLTTLAILPAHKSVPVREFALHLVHVLRSQGSHALHVDASRAEAAAHDRNGNGNGDRVAALAAWLHDLELDHDLVVYEAEPDATTWTTACLRQADTILVVGNGGAETPPVLPAALAHARSGTVRPRTELVLLHDPGATPAGTAAWLRDLPVDGHYHVTTGDDRDYQRLARCLLGTEIGLVLGGGGARGLAHIGVIRALEEARIPVDRVGGTSAGANIAAMHALGWSSQRILEETRRRFVDGGSLQDYTLPIHSLLRGERYHRIGEQLYGDRRIEDLPIPFFCVSTNLTRGEAFVHRSGLIRRGLRASMTVPGIAPAVFEGREVLVDGGVINNLPVDIMRSLGRGVVIGVNVSPRQELRLDGDHSDTPSPWRSLLGRLFGVSPRVPTIASILTRAVALPRTTIEADPRRQPDLLLEPPVAGFRLLQWAAIDALAEIGYRHARERLEHWDRTGSSGRYRSGA